MTVVDCNAQLTRIASEATSATDAVRFDSRGVVLVIGDDAGIADCVAQLAVHHRVTAVAPGIDDLRWPARVTPLAVRVDALDGHLGAFRAEMRVRDGMKDIGAASANRDGLFDLVLDLGRHPVWSTERTPLGYFAPGADPVARAQAVVAMRSLVGAFTKPRYYDYQPDWCAHGSSGITGCNRCLDVCSTSAISSIGDRIRVDPFLCQGCATCTLACPTGALSFKKPARDTLRRRLVDLFGSRAGAPSLLIVHGKSQEAAVLATAASPDALTLCVDPLPAFGDELWIDAFALGAYGLALVDDNTLLPSARKLIEAQLIQTRSLLRALGLHGDRLTLVSSADVGAWVQQQRRAYGNLQTVQLPQAPSRATRPAAPLPGAKRLAVLDGVACLGSAATAASGPQVLAPGASYGEVRVDRSSCTLCLACVNLCPTGALVSQVGNGPRLGFAEDACVQCGLCERGCPEKAMSLHPRFDGRPVARGVVRLLAEDDLQACTACGTPFINRKLLASSFKRLEGHPVLDHGGRERLMTCPACRQAALIEP